MNIESLVKKIAAIESLGTRVASFDYNGKRRNVIIGAANIQGGEYRSLAKSTRGNWYMVPRVMNDPEGTVKAFRLDRISNFRCSTVSNIN